MRTGRPPAWAGAVRAPHPTADDAARSEMQQVSSLRNGHDVLAPSVGLTEMIL